MGGLQGPNVDIADTNPRPPKQAAAFSGGELRGGLVLQVQNLHRHNRRSRYTMTVQNCTGSKRNIDCRQTVRL
jgi:hypothetical protein